MLHTVKSKYFAERLNKCLDDLGMPRDPRNRSAILSKLLHISRQQTRMLLEGYQMPDERVLDQLSQEFEIESGTLLAKK